MAGAIAGAMEKGRALAMVNTPRFCVVRVRQHIGDEGQVDGHVHAEAESADGHADEKAVEVGGGSDYEQRQPVHGRRGEDEDGLDQGGQEDLLRHLGLGAADLLHKR